VEYYNVKIKIIKLLIVITMKPSKIIIQLKAHHL